ncbi:YbbR-like domain-containing protein [uncultured Anaerococcus sp.]|uniref:CdaR family protein n=1 Tax=uncultured Anaerococcus sp. TaxID=293428 RepID=UPI00261F40E9|nr:CdaR family protein [uncultured Anaerococcus sp.]
MKKRNDMQLIILSVLLAVVMWAFVVTSTNPSVNRTFRNVPILVQNNDKLENKGYTIIGIDEVNDVNIKLEGSRDKMVNLKESDVQASIDVMNVREGIQSVKVRVDTPSGVNLAGIDPAEININVQKIITKKFPVNLVIKDSLKDGKSVEVKEQSLKEITVKGPASEVNKIDRVEVDINDPEYLDGKMHNIDIHILGKDGKEVVNVERSDTDVNVSFTVTETKRVKINLKTYGEVADGYEVKSTMVSPDDLVLKGNGQVLKTIDNVDTYPVNISNIKTDKEGDIRLNLPEGVSLYDGENPVNFKIVVGKKRANE